MSFFKGNWKVVLNGVRIDDIEVTDLGNNRVNIKILAATQRNVTGFVLTNPFPDARFFFIFFEDRLPDGRVRRYIGRVSFPASFDPSADPTTIISRIDGRVLTSPASVAAADTEEDWVSNRPVA